MSKYCIVIPYYRSNILEDEKRCISSVERFCSRVPVYWAGPEKLTPPNSKWNVVSFDSHFFESVDSYSRLLLQPEFYQRFTDFEWILICQLDAVLLMGGTEEIIDGSFDYIGAPWFRLKDEPLAGFIGCGNGGFSFRRVEAAIRVLGAERLPGFRLALAARRWMPDLSFVALPKRTSKALRVIRDARRGVGWYSSHYTLNEDKFWGLRARLFDPSFRIAPVEKALEFSFECFPRYCYELNGRRLPFGCHAWAKHDREFWEQFIDL